MSAGARSIFTLPKLSEASGRRRLQKKYGLIHPSPKSLKYHWNIFKEVANSENFPEAWEAEIIFFTKKWHDQLEKDNEWLLFQNYCYKYGWRHSMYWRTKVTQDLVWQAFANKLKEQNTRCDNYSLETLKHLISIGVGALPSFIAGDINSKLAPIENLQKILMEDYGTSYVPTILVPNHFQMDKSKSFGYYSINEPSLIESIRKNREISNVMETARNTQILFMQFSKMVIDNVLKIENTPIYSLIHNVKFDFCHTDFDSSSQLMLSSKLPKIDVHFSGFL